MTDEKLHESIERSYNECRRKVYKKIRKPVEWNGQRFESMAALGRHLKLSQSSTVSYYIRNKWKLKGFVPKIIKEKKL